jgi:Protein of unknown function (DUF4236)
VGFRFRRSLKVLPGVRLNFSRSGASVSLGPRGLRYTVGPKGTRATVGIPGTGLSWTEYTAHDKNRTNDQPGSPGQNPFQPLGSPAPAAAADSVPTPIESAPVEQIGVLSTSEFAPILNSVHQRLGFAPWVTIACVSYFGLALNSGNQIWVSVAPVYALLFIMIAISLDRYRRSIHIEYLLEGTAKTVAEVLRETFDELKACKAVWQINAQGKTSDWKRSAGASTIATRKRIYPKFGRPPCIRGNVEFPALELSAETLYFLPDTILITTRKSIAALPYQELLISARSIRFIEDEAVPSDASVVDQTWRFVNKKGGPDRRFNYNKQLPICLYGEMDFQSSSGLNCKIEYSNPSACDRFLKALTILHRPESLIRSKPITSFQKAKTWPSIFFWGWFVLALTLPLAGSIDNLNFGNLLDDQPTHFSNSQGNGVKREDVIAPKTIEPVRKIKRNRSPSAPLVITPDFDSTRTR